MTATADFDKLDRLRPQRLEPLRAFRAFRKLIRNKEDTAQVFEIMRALSGRSISRGYNRMLKSLEGGRQAFLREELAHKLDDPVWLSQFGPGSVGAAYREFRETRGFTAEEVGRMIMAARKRQRTLAGLPAGWWWSTLIYSAWCTGARIGELLALRWVNIRGEEIVFLAGTRKGHTRDIARKITPDLAAELELHRRCPGDLVWPWPHRPTSIYHSMRILCDQAGVPQRRFHALRKASASYVAAAGGDAVGHLDHSDANITRDHYLDDRIVGKAAGIDFLPRLDLGEDAQFIEEQS
jgi:integrase